MKIPKLYQEHLFPFTLSSDLVGSVKVYFSKVHKKIHELMDKDYPADRQIVLYSYFMDQLLQGLFLNALETFSDKNKIAKVTLFALGGYGRQEMNLYSDLDLLFLFEKKDEDFIEHLTQKVLYPLWDSGIEVGHSTRSIRDCKLVIQQDLRAFSSMLDARVIYGDDHLAEKFFKFLKSKSANRRVLKHFIRSKREENLERLKRFGDTVFLVEPNIKDSEGGLRNWHNIQYCLKMASASNDFDRWVRQGFLSNEQADELKRSLKFLWLTRNHLHRLSGKKNDKLLFELQEPIAKALGFTDSETSLAAEQFIQTYYQHASRLNIISKEIEKLALGDDDHFFRKIKLRLLDKNEYAFFENKQKLCVRNFDKILHQPALLCKGFDLLRQSRLELDSNLKYWIHAHLDLVDDELIRCDESRKFVKALFNDVKNIGRVLHLMSECGFLGVYVPEFGEIAFQTQYDRYHHYTTDTHSLIAVEELSKLARGEYDKDFPIYKSAYDSLTRIDLLAWGVWFHDLGKGRGGDHSNKGAELARKVMERFDYPEEDILVVDFLIRSHLIMPHLSQRRDLEDIGLIQNFSKTVDNEVYLKMLFILTWADIRAVGPDSWTPWKGNLLESLFSKTLLVLEKGDGFEVESIERASQKKEQALKYIRTHLNNKSEIFLNSVPRRYFLVNSIKSIEEHLDLIASFGEQGFVFDVLGDEKQRTSKLNLYSETSVSLLPKVTGVLASCAISIKSLVSYSVKNGATFLIMRVCDQQNKMIPRTKAIWKKFEENLSMVLRGETKVKDLMNPDKMSYNFYKQKKRDLPVKITFDNDVSAYYTVIQIYANDRLGLLYDIVSNLESLGVYVDVSKISTKVDQVSDVLYCKDIFRQKILDREKLKQILTRLEDVCA